MNTLTRLFGWPHELLHVLALILIGRRPEAITGRYVDIPDDLPTGQFVFVAGLPALVFWLGAAVCLRAIFGAADLGGIVLALGGAIIFALAGLGTMGDLQLIAMRLLKERFEPPDQVP